MTLYVIKPGDSIYTIANKFGVSPQKIITANGLENPGQLVVGESIIIPQGQKVHTVAAGESVYSIARKYGISQSSIIQANPFINAVGRIYPGQVLTIPAPGDEKLGEIEVNGYIFPGSDEAIVRPWLKSLTYLSIFSYTVNADGSLPAIDDDKWIQIARSNRVAPIMVITNIRPGGGFSTEIAHAILSNQTVQNNLIQNVVRILKQKNYYGLNIDFEYIQPTDRQNYNDFLRKITDRLHALGYIVLTAVAPKLNAEQKGLLYEAHDYPAHGSIVDRVILMTYEWGYLAGPPQAVAPLSQVKRVLDYAVSVIPPKKILMGIPNYAYDWVLPYVRGTLASTFSNGEAVARAFRNKAEIKYDLNAQSPYYNYYDTQKRQHIVWFEDARSIYQKLLTVDQYGLGGVSYWTIGRSFQQNLFLVDAMFNIKKVI